ncbi:hypothetical protein DC522_00020 [Microvirga sp. KLBC 81]|uniref:acyltransferase family protein n=1 Tax=Microvirga sp. KLBC 81 TaxID=1862707 RepID=UPI000D507035|nr:acyltransferase [Microvirga sp. KLBC 81]PVE26196.1 hypothetical protein DC522_00020 [Microvirga sp. KLBC 81]
MSNRLLLSAHGLKTSAQRHSVGIQWLRACAAITVLLFHASIHLNRGYKDPTFYQIFDGRWGILGVAIFFAISGYLMAHLVHSTDKWTFLSHRIIRIYPIFIAASLTVVAVSHFVGTVLPIDLIALSLVPVGQGPRYVLWVEWTLLFEIAFYVLMFLIAAFKFTRYLEVVALVWLCLSLGAGFAFPSGSVSIPTLAQLPFQTANVAFAGGLLIPWLTKRGAFLPAVAVLMLFLTLMIGTFDVAISRAAAGIVGVYIVGLITAQVENKTPGPIGLAMSKLGDYSYAIYLCHAPVILWTYKATATTLPAWAMWCAAVTAALLIGIMLGVADVKVYRVLRRWSDSTNPALRVGLVSIYLAVFAVVAAYGLIKT